ncbi:hypothetical protein MJG53_000574 [Ovis ammon polii x Ovis aries]|uniref:Uncharacterized protein n=1 Tax=Ovis ammon polii x Ovis aries TaxID=2918886 RepID=A0ACB9VJ82_9CETA|nr:hypothetical protein MJG53_000574 [Ovis ammon polii x Ovis aries]
MLSGGIRALLSEPPAEQSSTDLGSCGSPVAEATERGTERDWSPIQGALRSNRRIRSLWLGALDHSPAFGIQAGCSWSEGTLVALQQDLRDSLPIASLVADPQHVALLWEGQAFLGSASTPGSQGSMGGKVKVILRSYIACVEFVLKGSLPALFLRPSRLFLPGQNATGKLVSHLVVSGRYPILKREDISYDLLLGRNLENGSMAAQKFPALRWHFPDFLQTHLSTSSFPPPSSQVPYDETKATSECCGSREATYIPENGDTNVCLLPVLVNLMHLENETFYFSVALVKRLERPTESPGATLADVLQPQLALLCAAMPFPATPVMLQG